MDMSFKLCNHAHVSILRSCAPGEGVQCPRAMLNTWQSIMQMVSLYTNYCSSVFYLHHLHLLLCAVDDFELIGPPEYTGKMLHDIG